MEIFLIAMLVWAFACVFYIWSEWPSRSGQLSQAMWKRVVLFGGPCAITLQALLYVALWTPPILQRPQWTFGLVKIQLFLVFLVIPSVGFWRARSRWWLLASSCIFLVVSFVTQVGLIAE